MKNLKRLIFILFSLLCLLLGGCAVRINHDMTMHDDGSVDTIYRIVGSDGIGLDFQKKLQDAGAEVRPAHDNETGWNGVEGWFHDSDLASFLSRLPALREIDIKQYDIKKRGGWLCDYYSFDLTFSEKDLGSLRGGGYDKSDPNRVRFEFSLKLPSAAEESNADMIFDGGRTLKWDLAPILAGQSQKDGAHMRFRIWHMMRVLIVALVLAAIFFAAYRAWQGSRAGNTKKKPLALLCWVVCLAGIGWLAGTAMSFPMLTAEDAVGRNVMDKAPAASHAGESGVGGAPKDAGKIDAGKKNEASMAGFKTVQSSAAIGSLSEVDTSDVTTKTRELPNGKVEYPVLTLKNEQAAMLINRNIEAIVDEFVNNSETKRAVEADISYDVRENEEDFISVVVKEYIKIKNDFSGTTYEYFKTYGRVYDKRTGKRQLLNRFVNITPEEFTTELYKGVYLYKKFPGEPQILEKERRFGNVPENFFLDSRGNLFIMIDYTPKGGEKDMGCVRFSPEMIMRLRNQKEGAK